MHRCGVVCAMLLIFAVALGAGCATGPYISDAQYEQAKQARREQYAREEREERRTKREHREARDWSAWIDEQARPEGPVVLQRADLVLSAAISRAEYEGAPATQLTHLRMTAAARNALAEGNTERALDLLERAIAVDGSEGFAYLYLGHVYTRRGDFERSIGFLQQARRLLPPDPALRDELRRLSAMSAPIDASGMIR